MSNPKAPKFVDAKGRNRVDGGVFSVNDEIGEIYLDKTWVGLSNVDDTSDIDKPVSTATAALVEESVESVIKYLTMTATFTQDYVADDTLLIGNLPANIKVVGHGTQFIDYLSWTANTDFAPGIGTLSNPEQFFTKGYGGEGFNNFGLLGQGYIAYKEYITGSSPEGVYFLFDAPTDGYESIVGKSFRFFVHYIQL